MKKISKIIFGKLMLISLVIMVFSHDSNAQALDKVVLFSQVENTSSARAQAMGGAFTALGGDISSISLNPAALGVFSRPLFEISLQPSFLRHKATNIKTKDESFQIANMGSVITFNRRGSFRFNMGISYNLMNNFNRRGKSLIENSYSSMTDVFAAQSHGISDSENLDAFSSYLAYNTYLTYRGDYDQYFSILEYTKDGEFVKEPVNQSENYRENGYQGEYILSFGASVNDFLYLGLSFGIQEIDYDKRSIYTEAAQYDSPSTLDYYDYMNIEEHSGVGTNVKFGMIFRPIPEFRFGVSVHSPTWYDMTSSYMSQIDSYFNTEYDELVGREYSSYSSNSGTSSFDYEFNSPWKVELGVASVIMNTAIVSFDYEYVDYGSAELSNGNIWNSDVSLYEENKAIEDNLRACNNFRFGLELKPFNNLSLRFGYAFRDSPYKDDSENNNVTHKYSGGLGFSYGPMYLDLAYSYSAMKSMTVNYNYFYTADNQEINIVSDIINNKFIKNELRLTLGFRF